jgi:hypothetical protein
MAQQKGRSSQPVCRGLFELTAAETREEFNYVSELVFQRLLCTDGFLYRLDAVSFIMWY